MSPRLHHRGCRAARPRGHDTRNLADSRPRRGQRHTNGGDRLAGGPVAAGEARVVARLLVSDGGEGSAADSTWWPAKASGRPALSRNTIASSRSGPLVPATGTRLGSAPSPETIATRSATAATATIAATVALCRVTASFARSPELLVRSIACAWTCVRCPRPWVLGQPRFRADHHRRAWWSATDPDPTRPSSGRAHGGRRDRCEPELPQRCPMPTGNQGRIRNGGVRSPRAVASRRRERADAIVRSGEDQLLSHMWSVPGSNARSWGARPSPARPSRRPFPVERTSTADEPSIVTQSSDSPIESELELIGAPDPHRLGARNRAGSLGTMITARRKLRPRGPFCASETGPQLRTRRSRPAPP